MKTCFHLEHFDILVTHNPKLDCQMAIDVDYRYLEAKIEYGNDTIERWKNDDVHFIIKCLAHEVTHILTGNLSNPFKMKREVRGEMMTHFDEQVTEHVSRLLYRLYIKEYTV